MPAPLSNLLTTVFHKHWRLLLGLFFLGFAVVALTRNFIVVTATDAFINANLIAVRSPIPGQIARPLPPVGSRTGTSTLAQVRNTRADQTLTLEISQRLEQVDSALSGASARLEKLKAAEREFAAWSRRYVGARGVYLSQRQSQAAANREASLRQLENARSQLKRLEGVQAYISRDMLEQARTSAQVAEQSLLAATAETEQVASERAALGQRLQIADSYSERTYSEQKLQETRLQAAMLEADIMSLQQQRKALADNLQRSQGQLGRESLANVTVPDGAVWRRLPVGAHVERGGDLGQVAPCDDAVVTATLDRNSFDKLYVGMPVRASFRLEDGSRHTVELALVTLTGGSTENALGMAIPFGRAIVEDAFGAVLRARDPSALGCAIGRPVDLKFGA
jgi:hypothetical protein